MAGYSSANIVLSRSIYQDACAAIDDLSDQIEQMRGMFPDEDGQIAAALAGATDVRDALSEADNAQTAALVATEKEAVDLDSADKKQFFMLSIEWDTSDDDDIAGCSPPSLPETLLVSIDASLSIEEIDFANILSDRFGFCILSLDAHHLPAPLSLRTAEI